MSFGKRLQQARKENNLTQEELAKKIGIAKSTLAGYETDKREPDVMKINKLIKALNVSGEYLLGIESPTNPKATPEEIESGLSNLWEKHDLAKASDRQLRLIDHLIRAILEGDIDE